VDVYDREAPKIQKRIRQMEELLTFLAKLPDLPAKDSYASEDTATVFLYIPFDPRALLAMRRAMGNGWEFVRQTPYDEITHTVQRAYRKAGEKFEISICLVTSLPGATCQRVKVGEKVMPVYEVRCN